MLASRLQDAGVLGEHKPELFDGGYGFDETFDMAGGGYPNNPHTWVRLGASALGRKTIVDITADQFDPKAPAVYVGQLTDPWTDNPTFFTDGY